MQMAVKIYQVASLPQVEIIAAADDVPAGYGLQKMDAPVKRLFLQIAHGLPVLL